MSNFPPCREGINRTAGSFFCHHLAGRIGADQPGSAMPQEKNDSKKVCAGAIKKIVLIAIEPTRLRLELVF